MWIETQDGRLVNLAHAFSLSVVPADDNSGYRVIAWGTYFIDTIYSREIVARYKTKAEAQATLGQIKALILANGVLTPWSLLQTQK